jgi:hypothetical protein
MLLDWSRRVRPREQEVLRPWAGTSTIAAVAITIDLSK